MASRSGGPVAAAIAGVEAAGTGQGLADVSGAGAGAGRGHHLQPLKVAEDECEVAEEHGGPGQHSKHQLQEFEGETAEEHPGEDLSKASMVEGDGAEGCSQSSKVSEGEDEPLVEDGGEGPSKSSKVSEGEDEPLEEDGGNVPSQSSKVNEGEDEPLGEVGGEGPNQESDKEAPSAVSDEKCKGPATPSPERRDRRKGSATPRGPVLWLGSGNLNRVKTPDRVLTADEEDEKVIIILRDSRRVSDVELLKYNVVPDNILVNRSPSTRTAIHNLFRFLHESALLRRKPGAAVEPHRL